MTTKSKQFKGITFHVTKNVRNEPCVILYRDYKIADDYAADHAVYAVAAEASRAIGQAKGKGSPMFSPFWRPGVEAEPDIPSIKVTFSGGLTNPTAEALDAARQILVDACTKLKIAEERAR